MVECVGVRGVPVLSNMESDVSLEGSAARLNFSALSAMYCRAPGERDGGNVSSFRNLCENLANKS